MQAAAAPVPAPTATEPLPVSKEAAQETRDEARAAKAKRCEKAKADYDRMIQALKITTTDSQGNVTFLDSAQMDKTRLEARAVRDLACAP